MKMILSTRTPVHIGTGLAYHPNEFIHDRVNGEGQFIWRMDPTSLSRSFDESQRDEFIQRMDDAAAGEDFSLTDFIKHHGISPLPFRLYRLDNNTGELEPKEIKECIKTAGVPYIPGSSVKGAIRTALAWWHAKEDDSFPESIGSDLDGRRRSKGREIGNEYVASIFSLKPKEKRGYDAKYDLLKFFQVSDFMPQECSHTCESIHTYSLQQNRLKKKGYSIFAECVLGTFSGSVGGLDQIKYLVKSKELPLLKDKMHLLGLANPNDTSQVPSHLGKILTEWNRWCLEKEKALVRSDNTGTLIRSLENAESWLKESPHIRLGFGVGTLYQTLIGLLEEKDPDLAVNVREKLKLGKISRTYSSGDINPPYPKSIEFTRTGYPMGWVAVKMDGQ